MDCAWLRDFTLGAPGSRRWQCGLYTGPLVTDSAGTLDKGSWAPTQRINFLRSTETDLNRQQAVLWCDFAGNRLRPDAIALLLVSLMARTMSMATGTIDPARQVLASPGSRSRQHGRHGDRARAAMARSQHAIRQRSTRMTARRRCLAGRISTSSELGGDECDAVGQPRPLLAQLRCSFALEGGSVLSTTRAPGEESSSRIMTWASRPCPAPRSTTRPPRKIRRTPAGAISRAPVQLFARADIRRGGRPWHDTVEERIAHVRKAIDVPGGETTAGRWREHLPYTGEVRGNPSDRPSPCARHRRIETDQDVLTAQSS
mgnify:CR=1 FL=1